MKNTSIALLICLALWFPAQADALIISVHEEPDKNTYYNAGLCLDKYADAIGDRFYTYNTLPNGIELVANEPICIVGHGRAGSANGHTGAQIGTLLETHVTPNGVHTIQLMPCNSGTVPENGSSLVAGVVQSLTDHGWQGTRVIGANGLCTPNRNLAHPFLKTVDTSPAQGDCSSDAIDAHVNSVSDQDAVSVQIAHCMTQAPLLAIANCMYNDAAIIDDYAADLEYSISHHCTFTDNNEAFTDSLVP